MNRQVVTGFALGLGLGLVWWPLVPVVIAGIGGAPHLRRRVRCLRRERAQAEAVPEVIELILVAISSGTTLTRALALVADRGPPTIRDGWGQVLERHRTGEPLTLALRHLPTYLGPSYRTPALTLAQAERDGAPLGVLLGRLSDEARRARRIRDEAAARRLPVQLIFPLVLCSLPAVFVGAVVPLLVVSLGRL